ncbi:MAG: GNAT family N-acetyltransferase [Clostridia bacterium]
MLRISPTNDKKIINDLSLKIFEKDFEGDIAFVLYDDDKPIGFAYIKVNGNTAQIIKIGILESCRKKKMGDFFTRSLLFHFIDSVDYIEICYVSKYFEQLGFANTDKGTMIIKSNTIVFPSGCHK